MNRSFHTTFSLDIPGQWADVWLCKDHLVLWGRHNDQFVAPLRNLRKALEAHYGAETRVAADYLLFRNDWKSGAPFKALLEIPNLRESFYDLLSAGSQPFVVDRSELQLRQVASERPDGDLLDTSLYANRLFHATTAGLFQTYLDVRYPETEQPQVQLTDLRTSGVTAKYSCLNASSEEEGLWFKPIAWLPPGDDPADFVDDMRPTRLAEVSYDASFSSRNLLNYAEESAPELLRAKASKVKVHEGAKYDNWQVDGFDSPENTLAPALSALRSRAVGNTANETLTVLGNSDYHMLVEYDHHLSVLNIDMHLGGRSLSMKPNHKIRPAQLHDLSAEEALQTYPILGGFVVETEKDLLLINESGMSPVFSGTAAAVRTFRESVRYREVIAVIHEHGVTLTGYLQAQH